VETIVKNNSTESTESNPLFNPSVISHCENKLLPYIPIWGGFVLIGTGMTRVNNGLIEGYQGSGKLKTKKNVAPDVHIVETAKVVLTNCSSYLERVTNKKRKRDKNSEPGEASENENQYDGCFDECGMYDSDGEDGWNKGRTQPQNLKKSAPTGFQKSVNPDHFKTNQTKQKTSIFKSKKPAPARVIKIQVGGIELTETHLKILDNNNLVESARLTGDIVEAYVSMFNLPDSRGFLMPVNLTQLLFQEKQEEVFFRLYEVSCLFYIILFLVFYFNEPF
jgi:hypothetical protein